MAIVIGEIAHDKDPDGAQHTVMPQGWRLLPSYCELLGEGYISYTGVHISRKSYRGCLCVLITLPPAPLTSEGKCEPVTLNPSSQVPNEESEAQGRG